MFTLAKNGVGLTRLALLRASGQYPTSSLASYYLCMQFGRPYHTSFTNVGKMGIDKNWPLELKKILTEPDLEIPSLQMPSPRQQFLMAADFSPHGGTDPLDLVTAMLSLGIDPSYITLILAASQFGKKGRRERIAAFLRDAKLRGILVTRGSSPEDAEDVIEFQRGGVSERGKKVEAHYEDLCGLVHGTGHKLGLVLNPHGSAEQFTAELEAKRRRFNPTFLFTQPIFDPYSLHPEVRKTLEQLALDSTVRLTVGVINPRGMDITDRIKEDTDPRVLGTGRDRYRLPDKAVKALSEGRLDSLAPVMVNETLEWIRDNLRGGDDSIYVRYIKENTPVLRVLEGTEFDCKVTFSQSNRPPWIKK